MKLEDKIIKSKICSDFILTNVCSGSILNSDKQKDPSTSYKRCWRIFDNGRIYIHTNKFIDQNGREFDIAETMQYYYYIFIGI